MTKKNKFFTYIVISFTFLILLLGIFIYKSTYNIPNDDTLLKDHIINYLDTKVSMPFKYTDIEIKEIVNVDNIKFLLLEKDRNSIGAAYLKRSPIDSTYRIISIEFSNSNFKSISMPTSKDDILFFYGIKDENYDIDNVELNAFDYEKTYSMKIPDKKFFVTYTYMGNISGSKTSYDNTSYSIFDANMNDVTDLVTKTNFAYEFLNKGSELQTYILNHYLSPKITNDSDKIISDFLILDKEISKDTTTYYVQGLLYDLNLKKSEDNCKNLFIGVTFDKITSNIIDFKCNLDYKDINDFLINMPSTVSDSITNSDLVTEKKNYLKERIDNNINLIKNKKIITSYNYN
ncbi:hypothetical protein [Clostridium frigidicarnis]|uniref:Uncharacterized protein n=1 Tax=Clostridium frigidicarnis TaxID=84698 RepID=A0A1I1AA54_9CLOT|nr:hypothetical protein [Clostridium frigidicarnis]SFB34859.1 hypothetical protein SAMN04488528_103217 [Clostridium frigidicarnis]